MEISTRVLQLSLCVPPFSSIVPQFSPLWCPPQTMNKVQGNSATLQTMKLTKLLQNTMKTENHDTNHEQIMENSWLAWCGLLFDLTKTKTAVPAAHRWRALNPRDFWAPALNPRIRGDFHARSSVFPVCSSAVLARSSIFPFAAPPAGLEQFHGNFLKLQTMKLPKLT